MAEVLVGDLMRQYAAQLIVIGPLQQTHRDVELAIPSVRCVNVVLIDDADAYLIWAAWMIIAWRSGSMI